MIMYHGGFSEILKPKILEPQRAMDFSGGFYTTTSFEQAKKWALTKKDRFHYEDAVVFSFTFDLNLLDSTNLKCKIFKTANEEWLDFIMNNRHTINFEFDFDIVYGAVANDNVYASLNLYEDGFLSKTQLMEELKTWKYVDQLCFHTTKALNYLTFEKSEKVFKEETK